MEKKPVITLEGKTREEKKVIVAQDVIANILSGIYRATTGSYIENMRLNDDEVNNKEWSVRDNWSSIRSCAVCGVGACLISITKFNNKLSFNELPQQKSEFTDKSLQLLSEIFTPEELAIIEVAFEGSWEPSIHNIGRDLLHADVDTGKVANAMKFYQGSNQYSRERMIAIMQQIIDNNGEVNIKYILIENEENETENENN